MTASASAAGRLRAGLELLVALLYLFFARLLVSHGVRGLLAEAWIPLAEQALFVFMLLVGYASMGFWFDRQTDAIAEQGLPLRSGWIREAGMGLAAGWAVALVCILPMTLFGGIAIFFTPQLSQWGWLAADAFFFALAALAEEIAFRGYAFQRLERAAGPMGAALGFAMLYAALQSVLPGASRASWAVSFVLALTLSICYLRTRALWMSWGVNFGWKASRALLFGLAVKGDGSHSPLVQGDPMVPRWLSGGAFGLDGSWLSLIVLLALLPVVYRLTRDLDFRFNAPVFVPGGIPVDLDAIARAQHEAATAPAPPALVQIGNATAESAMAAQAAAQASQGRQIENAQRK